MLRSPADHHLGLEPFTLIVESLLIGEDSESCARQGQATGRVEVTLRFVMDSLIEARHCIYRWGIGRQGWEADKG